MIYFLTSPGRLVRTNIIDQCIRRIWNDSTHRLKTFSTISKYPPPYFGQCKVITLAEARSIKNSYIIGICGIRSSFSTTTASVDQRSLQDIYWTEISKKYSSTDRMSPDEWKLIYFHPVAERNLSLLWPACIFLAATCSIVVIFLVFYACMQQLSIGGISTERAMIAAVTLGLYISYRWPRIIVFRIYERRMQASTLPSQKNGTGKREYCIVWFNLLKRRRKFFYDHLETKDARERRSRIPMPNFYVRNRGWYVNPLCFRNSKDYFAVRVPRDIDD